MIERTQLAVNLAQKDYYPDLSVGYMYQQRPMMPDMHGMTFTVNIPVFYKSKQREEVRQATEERLLVLLAHPCFRQPPGSLGEYLRFLE